VSLSLLAILFSTAVMASENPVVAEKKEGDFNVTETILEHIKDDHSWHLWGHTSIHLPVILYTS
jgi:F-type H+-transporting ATPase subunit a